MAGKVESTIGAAAPDHQAWSLVREALVELLRARGELVLPVRGSSMGRAWVGAEGVVVRARPARAPRRGEVLVFTRAGRWYAHRCLATWSGRLVTKGDGRWAWDRPLVPPDSVVGVVVALMQRGRRVDLPSRAPVRAWWEMLRALVVWPWWAVRKKLAA